MVGEWRSVKTRRMPGLGSLRRQKAEFTCRESIDTISTNPHPSKIATRVTASRVVLAKSKSHGGGPVRLKLAAYCKEIGP